MDRPIVRPAVVAAGAVFCLTPYASPPLALALGAALALAGLTAFEPQARTGARLLIQVCIVLLGFRMDLHEVVRAGTAGLLFAAGTIVGTFALGHVLGRLLGTDATLTTLLSSGTAICGGSAIAATGAVIRATAAQISLAIGVVFLLNAAALYLFPPLGHALELSDAQFGTWAAVAIHDVSSVVGAATQFDERYGAAARGASPAAGPGAGGSALDIATAVKLSRTLWIVPVAAAAGWWFGRSRTGAPARVTAEEDLRTPASVLAAQWFIALFVVASALRTVFPEVAAAAPALERTAKTGMTLALFLIGSGLSRRALAAVGWRPLLQAVILWLAISAASLPVVRFTIP